MPYSSTTGPPRSSTSTASTNGFRLSGRRHTAITTSGMTLCTTASRPYPRSSTVLSTSLTKTIWKVRFAIPHLYHIAAGPSRQQGCEPLFFTPCRRYAADVWTRPWDEVRRSSTSSLFSCLFTSIVISKRWRVLVLGSTGGPVVKVARRLN